MNGAQHTPGPWEVVYGDVSGYPRAIKAPLQSPQRPGGIVDITRWNAISMPSSAEGQANARLMAAAPDLLAALQAAFDMRVTQHPKWEAIARAAIAKATEVAA